MPALHHHVLISQSALEMLNTGAAFPETSAHSRNLSQKQMQIRKAVKRHWLCKLWRGCHLWQILSPCVKVQCWDRKPPRSPSVLCGDDATLCVFLSPGTQRRYYYEVLTSICLATPVWPCRMKLQQAIERYSEISVGSTGVGLTFSLGLALWGTCQEGGETKQVSLIECRT